MITIYSDRELYEEQLNAICETLGAYKCIKDTKVLIYYFYLDK